MPKNKLTKFEVECMERRARGRAAWGMYGAYRRQQNLIDECNQMRIELSHKGTSSSEIEKKIEKFVESKSNNLLYIG